MKLIPKQEFLEHFENSGLEIIWFVELYRTKNALYEAIKSNNHPMKTRKYLVWYNEEGNLISEKFWDARFSNQLDKDPTEPDEEKEEWHYPFQYDDQPGLRPDEMRNENESEPEE